MDTSLIILGVALIIVLYFVFYYMTMRDSLADRLDLAQAQPPIVADKLTKPENGKYSYELWMYVYGPKSITADSYIFSRDGSAGKKNIGLKLKANVPSLVLEYDNGASTAPQILITDNFPFQSWVHVLISVENKYVDVYMNGKLVKSTKDLALVLPPRDAPLTFGISQTYLAKFTRVAEPTDPQTAWSHYMDGNGENPIKKFTGDYKVAVSFRKGEDKSSAYNLNIIGEQ